MMAILRVSREDAIRIMEAAKTKGDEAPQTRTFQPQRFILPGDNPGFLKRVADDLTTATSFDICTPIFQGTEGTALP